MFVYSIFLTDQKKNHESKKGEKPKIDLPEDSNEQLEVLSELKNNKLPFEEAAMKMRDSLSDDHSDVSCPGKECVCFILFLAKHKSFEEGVAALRLMKGLAATLGEGKGQSSPGPPAPKPAASLPLVEDMSDEEGDNLDPSCFDEKEIALQRPPLIQSLTRISLPTINKTYL